MIADNLSNLGLYFVSLRATHAALRSSVSLFLVLNTVWYDITYKKTKTQKFFSLQTWRLAESFEGLNSSLVQSAKELYGWQDNWNMLDLTWFVGTIYLYIGSECVNHVSIYATSFGSIAAYPEPEGYCGKLMFRFEHWVTACNVKFTCILSTVLMAVEKHQAEI